MSYTTTFRASSSSPISSPTKVCDWTITEAAASASGGSTDVLLNGCEAYRACKHNFGIINSTQFVGSNLIAAYAAPGHRAGNASAYVPL